MSGAYDWVSNLQEIMWGALTAPCIETSFDGGHDQAERKYPYVDGAAHDNTGRTPYSVRATLVFNNTIASDMLPARLEKWLDALENGKIDGLAHPVLGNIFARVLTWSANVDPSKDRGGITLQVTWVESFFDPTELTVRLPGEELAPKVYGKALDQAMQLTSYSVPDGLGFESFELAVDNLGTLPPQSLDYTREAERIAGYADTVSVEVSLRNVLRDVPVGWLSECLTMGLRAQAATGAAQNYRNVQRIVLPNDIGLDAFAKLYGNTFEDALGLNASLVTGPMIKAGTTLSYYGGG
jgi:hypothetical protein